MVWDSSLYNELPAPFHCRSSPNINIGFVRQLRQHCRAWNSCRIWTHPFRCQIHGWVDDGVAGQQRWNTSIEHRWCVFASRFNLKKTQLPYWILYLHVGCWLWNIPAPRLFWKDQCDTSLSRWRFPDMFVASYHPCGTTFCVVWGVDGYMIFDDICLQVTPFLIN